MRETDRTSRITTHRSRTQIAAASAHTSAAGRYTAQQHERALDRLLGDIIALETQALVQEPGLRLATPMTPADLIDNDPNWSGQAVACLA